MARAPRTTKAKAAAPAAAPTSPSQPEATQKEALAATEPAETDRAAPSAAAGDQPLSDAASGGLPSEGELTRVLVASVSLNGRRRAGQGFGPEPVELQVSDATLELLEADPQLIVKRG